MGAVRSSLRQSLPADGGRHPARFAETLSDDEAFASLYRDQAPGVYAAAMRVLGRAGDAEDVTQEVFIRFWRDPGRFDPRRGELGSYLRLMARSRALDLWRHEQAGDRARDRLRLAARDERPPLDDQPEAAAERDERQRSVRSALKRLPPAQREALVLSYWASLSPHEIALRAGVPFGTARSRMRLGLEKLRRECSPALADAAEG